MSGPDFDALAAALGPLGRRDASLAPFCTYRVGGSASLLVEADSISDLEHLAAALSTSSSQGCSLLMVGKGSNLLVSDAGFAGVAVHLGPSFEEVTIDHDRATVEAGGAALLPVVARKSAAAGLTGFEWAVGVPGSMGGAVKMNAGGHGSDMAASTSSVLVFDVNGGDGRRWQPAELEFGYRTSALGPGHLVLSVSLALAEGDADAGARQISEIVKWRREHQPGGQNAGSVFTNPPGDSAGRLIDELGLKGFRIGTAEVSTKHANFIQADPDGSADDVFALIREVRLRIAAATGVELDVENRLIGFDREGLSP